ncbi:alcohol dehydrogenase catalytic domain-containing protein [Nocardioides houyundeii]|uniref:alcohol dehydrogenase catalytic domain-containing protein n=1 Tax=Nocardioides houyundeii TaxID=2045452 RepID=UPI0018F02D1F|nr:alcohol dehydrogenase catalytic domain-containing protein [Nocardioides houyundeii]
MMTPVRSRPTRAAVLRVTGEPLRLEELEIDAPRAGEVLVRIAGTGLCHTDLLPRAWTPSSLPLVTGHEGAGVVESVGPDVHDVRVGDHVVMSYAWCTDCVPCRTGRPSYCADFSLLNFSPLRPDGSATLRDRAGSPVGSEWFGQSSLAEHAVVAARSVVVVDRDLPLELLGPFGCSLPTGALAALGHLRAGPGRRIGIFGAGAVGLAAVMAARAAGADRVVVVEPDPVRRALALELGATEAHHPDHLDDEADGLRGQLDGVLETSGASPALGSALASLAPLGDLALVGGAGTDLPWRAEALVGRSVTYLSQGGAVPRLAVPMLLGMWERGLLPYERLVTTYPLTAAAEAEADLASGRVVKPVVLPGAPLGSVRTPVTRSVDA